MPPVGAAETGVPPASSDPSPAPAQTSTAATPAANQALARVDVAPSSAGSSTPVTVASLPAATPAPGFDLGQAAAQSTAPANPITLPSSNTAPAQRSVASVSDAFADLLSLPDTSEQPRPGNAVDITAIEIPREEAAAPEPAAAPPEPEKPANVSRIWVQVATGRDRSALKFDWRRLSRQAPEVLDDNGPFVASWGEMNRLLAGPFSSRSAANSAVSALSEQGIDAFRFTSANGEEIEELD